MSGCGLGGICDPRQSLRLPHQRKPSSKSMLLVCQSTSLEPDYSLILNHMQISTGVNTGFFYLVGGGGVGWENVLWPQQ